jgi:hypothetical protein
MAVLAQTAQTASVLVYRETSLIAEIAVRIMALVAVQIIHLAIGSVRAIALLENK